MQLPHNGSSMLLLTNCLNRCVCRTWHTLDRLPNVWRKRSIDTRHEAKIFQYKYIIQHLGSLYVLWKRLEPYWVISSHEHVSMISAQQNIHFETWTWQRFNWSITTRLASQSDSICFCIFVATHTSLVLVFLCSYPANSVALLFGSFDLKSSRRTSNVRKNLYNFHQCFFKFVIYYLQVGQWYCNEFWMPHRTAKVSSV